MVRTMKLGALLAGALAARASTLDISISDTATHAISPTLYGYMWEDINHSGDGGLYAELLQNRAFQIVTPGTPEALNAWEAVKGVSLAVVNNTAPVSAALPNSLAVTVARGTTGTVSFANTGYWGIKVTANATYTGSFYVKSSAYAGPVSVSLQGNRTGTVYARATPVTKVSGAYTKHTFTLTPHTSAPDAANRFVVELAPAGGAAATVHFGLFSLFPPTYKGRPNGMRVDLAETLAATRPRIWRFPGGNNLEGQSIASRWKWNETIGPLEQRPGRMGDWGYVNDDGLGLMEYLQWAEDIGAEVILGVWAGYALAGTPQNVPQDQLQPYINEVMDEIHFLTDANTTTWGALRAKYGRSEPYPLKYIEVGNEDFFSNTTYAAYRWPMYVTQLKKAFPHLNYIDTAYASTNLSPAASYIDYHNYNSPTWFANNTQIFDSYNRSLQYFVGEYAVISVNESNLYGTPAEGRFVYPEMRGSVAEAAFMTGMERNSDVVFASAYAPSLQHINGTQWTPDLVTYDAYTRVRSTSYYVQQLFATHLGTHVLATTPPAGAAPLAWVASVNRTSGAYFLKVANTGATPMAARLALGFAAASPARVTVLAGAPLASNTLEAPDTVVPVAGTVPVQGGNHITYTFPAYGVVVFELAKAAGPTSTVSSGAPKPSCVAGHWEQCGGIGFTGCTACATGTTCKLSPDSNGYYASCL